MIFRSDREQHCLRRLVAQVASLQPGLRLEIDERELCDLPNYEHKGGVFTPADQILENIVGSAYEFYYWYNSYTQRFIFERLKKPSDTPVYISPDRRHNNEI